MLPQFVDKLKYYSYSWICCVNYVAFLNMDIQTGAIDFPDNFLEGPSPCCGVGETLTTGESKEIIEITFSENL